jgi:hypothetical protein
MVPAKLYTGSLGKARSGVKPTMQSKEGRKTATTPPTTTEDPGFDVEARFSSGTWCPFLRVFT